MRKRRQPRSCRLRRKRSGDGEVVPVTETVAPFSKSEVNVELARIPVDIEMLLVPAETTPSASIRTPARNSSISLPSHRRRAELTEPPRCPMTPTSACDTFSAKEVSGNAHMVFSFAAPHRRLAAPSSRRFYRVTKVVSPLQSTWATSLTRCLRCNWIGERQRPRPRFEPWRPLSRFNPRGAGMLRAQE